MLTTLHQVSETIYNSKYELALFTGLFNCWLQLSEAIEVITGRIIVQKHKTFGFCHPSTIVSVRALFYPHGLQLRPKPSQSQLSLTALARPVDFKSLSHRKPGQSCDFQAKPGWNITIDNLKHPASAVLLHQPLPLSGNCVVDCEGTA